MSSAGTPTPTLEDVDRLIDEHRITSLWFLRPDDRPSTIEARVRLLEHIRFHQGRIRGALPTLVSPG